MVTNDLIREFSMKVQMSWIHTRRIGLLGITKSALP